MIEKFIVITNNPLCSKELSDKHEVKYYDASVKDIYLIVRDYIHKGHILLTHPLLSSVKPNETPYRSILISKKKQQTVDFQSLEIMENSIYTLEKFLKDFRVPNWTEEILKDFQYVDYHITINVIH